MKRKILFLLNIMLLITACTESGMLENELWTSSKYERFLNIAAGNVTLEASGTTSYVSVEATTTPWEFSKLESWLTISPLSGQSDTKVGVSATQNHSGDDVRTCVVSLNSTANDYKYIKPLTVTQAAATPFIDLPKSSVALPAIGGTETINVETNVRYTTSVSSLALWLTVESAPDMKSLTITAAPNATAEERSASVVLSGKVSQTINVTQNGAGLEANVTDTIVAPRKGGNYSMHIHSDAAWTASVGTATWIDIEPGFGSAGESDVVLSVAPNNSIINRDANIQLKIGDKEVQSIYIEQEGLKFSVEVPSLDFNADNGSQTVKVYSNAAWKILSTLPSWLTVSSNEGEGDASLTFTASEYNELTERTTIVVIGIEGITGLQETLSIKQSGRYFTISPTEIPTIPSTGGTHNIKIATDESWTANHTDSWLTLSASSGRGDVDVTMTAADNPSVNSRETKVIFTPVLSDSVTVVVKQAARYLTVDNSLVTFFARGGESSPIAICTDGTFEIQTSAEWLTVVQSGNSFVLKAVENDTNDYRETEVTVVLTGLLEGESYKITIPVFQRTKSVVNINTFPSDEDWNLKGTTSFGVTVTGFSTDEDWNLRGTTSFGVTVTGFSADEDWNF